MFFEKRVPVQARAAYRKDAWAALVVGVYAGAIGPFVMIIARDKLHATELQIGLMIAAPAIGSMFALFWANAMEGKSKMPFYVGSLVVGRFLFVGMLFCFTPLYFTVCFVVAQILFSISGPAYSSILKDIYPDEHRGRIMSYCRVLLAIVMIVSTVAAGHILDRVSYRYVFPIGALFGVASAMIFGRIRMDKEEQRNYKKPPTGQFLLNAFAILREDKAFRWFAMSVFTYGFGNLLVSPIYSVFVVDCLQIKTWQQSWLTMLMNIAWTLSFLYWGRYVDIKSPVKCAAVSVFVTAMIPANYFIAGYFGTAWALFPAYLISGVVNAGIELAYLNAVLQFSDEARVPQYQALHSFLFGIRGTIAPIIGASMKNIFDARGWDFRYLFVIAFVTICTAGFMQLIGIRGKYSDPA